MQRPLPDNPIDATPLYDKAADVLKEATRQGASGVAVDVSVDQGYTVTVRLGAVDVLEYHRNRSLEVTVYFGQKVGMASTSDLSPPALLQTVSKACHIAKARAKKLFSACQK